MWQYNGQHRPPFADQPGPGQESVWDYPRPPRLERSQKAVEVRSGERLIAHSKAAFRVVETASPPTYYLSPTDLVNEALQMIEGRSVCEWKGAARYLALVSASSEPIGWCYPTPTAAFADIAGYVSFYPGRVSCWLDGELVKPQPGGFYGGWLTADIVGPVKGEPGTEHW